MKVNPGFQLQPLSREWRNLKSLKMKRFGEAFQLDRPSWPHPGPHTPVSPLPPNRGLAQPTLPPRCPYLCR